MNWKLRGNRAVGRLFADIFEDELLEEIPIVTGHAVKRSIWDFSQLVNIWR